MRHALCLNTGSSSLKFALYDLQNLEKPVMSGSAERIGLADSRLEIEIEGQPHFNGPTPLPTHERAVFQLLAVFDRASLPKPAACVHRLVHGGPHLIEPTLITEEVRRELASLAALAPLHTPHELAVIEAATHAYPNASQIACFDTAFHYRMPEIAKRLPLPRRFWESGIRRYGFHGLSYESVLSQLEGQLSGRAIVAHLGNGCSMAALRDGLPQETTMGLTPTGGLMMGTRSGDLDPGVFFYLLRQSAKFTDAPVADVERLINDDSGLMGVSGLSRSMEDLLKAEAHSLAAYEAIELFCYTAVKFIGSLYAVLDGLDNLVFAGGIGENSAAVRTRICRGLRFAGVNLNPAWNESNASLISEKDSPCIVRVVRTNENLIMAKHAINVLLRQTPSPTLEGPP